MKRKIIDYYGDRILLSGGIGKNDILTFKESASSIIHTFLSNTTLKNELEEKKRLILTAAKLVNLKDYLFLCK